MSSIRQMSMPKPVRARTWRPPLSRPAGGPDAAEAARRVARAGRAAIRRQHPSSPESAARKVSASVRRAHIPDTYAASGPESGTWKDPDPRRRSSRGSGGSEQPAYPAMAAYATPATCPVSTTSWRYGLRRTCRLVTGRSHRPRSTWPNQARLAFLAVTYGVTDRYKRTHCLWLEQFQIADYFQFATLGVSVKSSTDQPNRGGSAHRAIDGPPVPTAGSRPALT
jgi:hypothetical protein